MGSGQHKLREELLRLQERKLYFLMGAAGASIGFSVTQMDGLQSPSAVYVFVASITSFGFSIMAGLRQLSLDARLIQTNAEYLDFKREFASSASDSKTIREVVDVLSFNPLFASRNLWSSLQVMGLLFGAVLTTIWKFIDCSACMNAWALIKGN